MEKKTEQNRIRIAYKISAKGIFQPDVTSESENVETAIKNLEDALKQVKALAVREGAVSE